VLRIHGTLLAIGELCLTLSDEEISANPEFFQVPSLVSFLNIEHTILPGQTSSLRAKVGTFVSR
jgi:hypothetical protein